MLASAMAGPSRARKASTLSICTTQAGVHSSRGRQLAREREWERKIFVCSIVPYIQDPRKGERIPYYMQRRRLLSVERRVENGGQIGLKKCPLQSGGFRE